MTMLAASLLFGCTEPASESTIAQELTTVAERPADTRAANEYEREMKRAEAETSPAGPIAQTVDWAEAAGFKRVDAKMLRPDQAAKLQAIRLPVLVFDDLKLLGTGLVTHHENWYVVAVEADGLNMNIRGNRNAMTAPGMEIPEAARKAAESYTLTRTHGIVTVGWRSFNVSYSLDIECSQPTKDTRCTADEFALEMAEGLAVIGGQP
jgi:hypothetical protein